MPGDDDQTSRAASARAPRRRLRLLVGAALGLVILWVAAGLVAAALGATAARAGADQVRAVDLSAGVGELLEGNLDRELAAAHDEFRSADRLLGNPILAPAKVLPVVGRQLRSATALASSARAVLAESTAALAVLRAETQNGAPTGADRIASLDRLRTELRAVEAVLDSVDLGPEEALVGPLREARSEMAAELAEARARIDDVLTVADGLHTVLAGPSRYLVLAANNAEMRIGSGMFLSVGAIDVEDGRVRVAEQFQPAQELVLGEPVPVPPEIEQLWGWSSYGADYRGLGLTARFPVNAEVASSMWRALGHSDVDGVMAIDVPGIQAFLRIAGPVEVDGTSVDADGVVPYLLREQYRDVDPGDPETNDARRDRLRTIASAAVEGLGSADIDLGRMLDELREARDGRHVMFWAHEPPVQRAWEALRVDGDLEARSMLVGLANFDGSKLDPYIDVSVEVAARRDGEDVVVEAAIRLTNRAPEGLPDYVAGAEDPDSYVGVVVAHLPAAASDISLVGFDGRAASGRDGDTQVIGSRVDLPRGEALRGDLQFRIPADELAAVRVEPAGRVPATEWTIGGRTRRTGSQWEWPPHVP